MRMSLMGHLQELRGRLFRAFLAIAALGIASLIFAKPIFGILMRPVLSALPPESRALIYTSGIEEINVLMKVGLYCGIFLSTPVILWQIWGFVSPGLYPSERKYAGPFIVLGSLAFVAGTLFCYFALLPTMFRFLLESSDSAPLQERLTRAKLQEEEALRFLRMGDFDRAGDLAVQATSALQSPGEGQVAGGGDLGLEVSLQLEAQGRLLDAARDGAPNEAAALLRRVLEKRQVALESFGKGELDKAKVAIAEAGELMKRALPEQGESLTRLWKLEEALALGKAHWAEQTWTRPMLTMSEQLSLVLVLELALGIIFELPMVMALLGILGIIKASFLMRYQRHAFIVCLIAAALVTPSGDAINLMLMAGPMLLCYELGVFAVWFIEKRRQKEADTLLAK
jgi:sec-independent protein translocase protein TatC